jgi:hypothetical protein
MASIPVFAAAKEGYAFIPKAWKAMGPAIAIMCVLIGLLNAKQIMLAGAMATTQTGAGEALVWMFLMIGASIVLQAGLFRLYLDMARPNPINLTLGQQEGRLLGVTAGVMGLFMLVSVILVLILMGVLGALLAQTGSSFEVLDNSDPAGAMAALNEALGTGPSFLMLALVLAATGFIVWLGVRLSLVSVATLAEGRMMMLETMKWTKGDVLSILAVMIVVGAPILLVTEVVSSGIQSALGVNLNTPEAMYEGGRLVVGQANIFLASILHALLSVGTLTVALSAVFGFLYRGLRPQV